MIGQMPYDYAIKILIGLGCGALVIFLVGVACEVAAAKFSVRKAAPSIDSQGKESGSHTSSHKKNG